MIKRPRTNLKVFLNYNKHTFAFHISMNFLKSPCKFMKLGDPDVSTSVQSPIGGTGRNIHLWDRGSLKQQPILTRAPGSSRENQTQDLKKILGLQPWP